MKQWVSLLLAILCLLVLGACSLSPEQNAKPLSPDQYTALEPDGEALPEGSVTAEIPYPEIQASAPTPELPAVDPALISLDELESVEDVCSYLSEVLPYEGKEELIPYAADLYTAGDCTWELALLGFCTRSGEIVTKPVFREIRKVAPVGDIWPEGTPQYLYLCQISCSGSDMPLITEDGRLFAWSGAFEGYYSRNTADESEIRRSANGEAVYDDGVYRLDGLYFVPYEIPQEDGSAGYWDLMPREGERRTILRDSDEAGVAETERENLVFCELIGGGRVYYTKDAGYCCTYDGQFRPILRLPALGARQLDLFESTSNGDGAQEEWMLSDQEQYEANIFLSNFSEQGFSLRGEGWTAEASDAELFRFAHLWAKINRHELIGYENDFEIMDLDAVNLIVDRFFLGRRLSPAEGTDYSADLGMGRFDWDRCFYRNGKFYYPAADGESRNCFTVVDRAMSDANGHSTFFFTIYELDLDIYWRKGEIPGEYYRLRPEEAAQRAEAGEIHRVREGYAVCVTRTRPDNGRQGYSLLYYLVYGQ